ncbi:hypothetical protein [Acinetobacter sp. MD2(2019)]|uniref:hypothetical protein n=1 Tax=Acinetobacter sp. MD2(2019) TaxID=2605273 RepID=UPI002D1F99E2|nr:hypothetical protein [Acinetobacter sp. MD2(2019)]MEB3754772.1 hypothetical protein [Acinetobacter sp. MD2(2019)]
MKKKILILSLIISPLFGCASTVVTYDRLGQMTGSCKATKGFLIGGKAACYGYANQLINSGEALEDIPESSKIYLGHY